MAEGVNLLCPDNQRRHCFPILAQYIADYEEQRVLASIVSGYCVKCTLPSHRSNVASGVNVEKNDYPPRTQQQAFQLRALHADNPQTLHHQFGLKPSYPFTKDIPHLDIRGMMCTDLLHRVSKCF